MAPWPDVAPFWAAIEPLSARESFSAQQASSTVTHRLTFRYRSDATSGMRIAYADPGTAVTRYFYFDGTPLSPDESREFLTVLAQEQGA